MRGLVAWLTTAAAFVGHIARATPLGALVKSRALLSR